MKAKLVVPKSCDDLVGAIALACGAVQYMASNVAISQETFRHLAHHEHDSRGDDDFNTSLELSKKHRKALKRCLLSLNTAMNQLGDYINGCDGCERIDEIATTSAFEVVKHVLRAAGE